MGIGQRPAHTKAGITAEQYGTGERGQSVQHGAADAHLGRQERFLPAAWLDPARDIAGRHATRPIGETAKRDRRQVPRQQPSSGDGASLNKGG